MKYQVIVLATILLGMPLSASAQSMEEKIRNLEATVEQLQDTLIKKNLLVWKG